MRFYDDLHILIERHEKAQKALNGKLPELTAQHLGYIGLTNAEQIGGLDLFQAAIFHDRVDFEHELQGAIFPCCLGDARIPEIV